jgi:hypothetical protein
MRLAVVMLLLALCGCGSYYDGAAAPDPTVKPKGKGWFCSIESSGMLSLCERSEKLCKRGRRFLAHVNERRGSNVIFSRCAAATAAYCYTASRKLNDHDDDNDHEADDEMEAPREKVWQCHATMQNCLSNRDNMYGEGFTDVSLCRRWH